MLDKIGITIVGKDVLARAIESAEDSVKAELQSIEAESFVDILVALESLSEDARNVFRYATLSETMQKSQEAIE